MDAYRLWISFYTIVRKDVIRIFRIWPQTLLPSIITSVLYFLIFVSLIFSAVGMIVALVAEEFEHLSIATTFVITPLIFFGGVFHSIDMVPNFLRSFTVFNPMFYMVNGMRSGMLGVSDVPVWQGMTVVFALAAGLLMILVYLFRIGFKLRK